MFFFKLIKLKIKKGRVSIYSRACETEVSRPNASGSNGKLNEWL